MSKKIMIPLMLLMLLLCGSIVCGEEIEPAVAFESAIVELNRQTGCLTQWAQTGEQPDPEAYIDLLPDELKESALEQAPGWKLPGDALAYYYTEIWGDRRVWSLEQRQRFAQLMFDCGLEDHVSDAIPGDEELTMEEARVAVREYIREQGTYKGYDGSGIDFENYVEGVHFYRYADGTTMWDFCYYENDVGIPTHEGCISGEGVPMSVSYYDPLELDTYYRDRCGEHDGLNSCFWPLEEQYALRQEMLELYPRQMEVYGYVRNNGANILETEYILPAEDMITLDQAVEIAREAAKGENEDHLAKTTMTGASLIRGEDGREFYRIGFFENRVTLLLRIELDARTGEVIPAE